MTPSHDPLSALLRTGCTVEPERTPGFRPAVWARIEALRRPETWAGWIRRHALPVGLAAVLAVALASGGAGWLARSDVAAEREAQILRYLAGLDPYLLAASPHSHPAP
jgi:hypothetical protein